MAGKGGSALETIIASCFHPTARLLNELKIRCMFDPAVLSLVWYVVHSISWLCHHTGWEGIEGELENVILQ